MKVLQKSKEKVKREASFGESLLIIVISLAMLMVNIVFLKGDAHVPLILATALVSLYAVYRLGYKWDEVMDGIAGGIKDIASTLLIFGIIGMMIAAWIQAGIVPTLIYYGLKLMNPKLFLVLTMLICALVSTSTGSSWTTVGTMGIVFLGIGAAFGVPMYVTAGASISGAYFGDKISPLSDTTNLAPAVAGTSLFDHIKHMLVSSGIGLVVSSIIFMFLGFRYGGSANELGIIEEIEATISGNFYVSPILLLVPCSVILMGILKQPPIPSLFLGVILGCVCCVLFQGESVSAVGTALQYGFVFESGSDMLNTLLSGGGIQSMMWSMSLTLSAICYGSVLDVTNILIVLAKRVLRLAKGDGGLITCVVVTCLCTNIITGDQYLGLILPGKMYRKEFEERGLAPQNLSRALEDAATVTSPLVPWSSCAAVMVGALGIPTLAYLPYCFFCLVSPVISKLLGLTGLTITRLRPKEGSEAGRLADKAEGGE